MNDNLGVLRCIFTDSALCENEGMTRALRLSREQRHWHLGVLRTLRRKEILMIFFLKWKVGYPEMTVCRLKGESRIEMHG